MDTFIVKMKKPTRGEDTDICFVIEAESAAEAVRKVDVFTGMSRAVSVQCEIFEGKIFPKNVNI